MTLRQPPANRSAAALPATWLISDARNDADLETALRRLPRGSGLIYRHYHLRPQERRRRFMHLCRIARAKGHRVVIAGDRRMARRWGADGIYGAPDRSGGAAGLIRLATVHDMRELAAAHRHGCDLVLISPVFPTRSHPRGQVLGVPRALLLAARSCVPVILLGGMDKARARRLCALGPIHGWAAIDGLST